MLIKKLILHKYKRFFLNNIETLIYTPESSSQIILGANGSGKSSLFRELNPLPADIKKNYYDGGYKEIHIEHNHSYYVLTSGKISPNKHSFIKDEQELNEGGTKTVQTDLVLEHFEIDSATMNVLLGIDLFTRMSPNERKHWLSKCSSVDYNYAISVFLKLRTKHRDLVGGIKLLNDEIIKNETITKSNNNVEKLKEDKTKIEEFISYVTSLYEHHTQNRSYEEYIRTLKQLNNEIRDLQIPTTRVNEEELVKQITLLEEEYKNTEDKRKNLIFIIEKSDKLTKYRTVEELKEEISIEQRQIETLKSSVDITKYTRSTVEDQQIEDVYLLNKILEESYSTLVDIFSHIDQYDDVRKNFNKEYREQTERTLEQLASECRKYKTKIDMIVGEIKHIESHKQEDNKVVCEKCFHSWYHKYDPNRIETLDKQKKLLAEQLEKYEKELEQCQKIKTRQDEFKIYLSTLQSTLTNSIIKGMVLNHINLLEDNSTKIINSLNHIAKELNSLAKIKVSIEKINLLQKELKDLEYIEELKKVSNIDPVLNLEKELSEITYRKKMLSVEIENNKKLLDNYKIFKIKYKELYDLSYKLSPRKDEEIRLRNEAIVNITNYFKSILIDIETKLNDYNTSYNKLEKDKKLLTSYKEQEKVLKLMVKELSPNEGLIAKSMNSFINMFIIDINDVINSIWSYSMELLPCDLTEDNDLDYKFKVLVNEDEVIEDISKLSSSMQEIVNLAFRIVLCRYLRLKEVPLYLDEFGSTFDSKHRTVAYQVIDKILASDFKQIFIICHYNSLVGSLTNSDFNVLSRDNIEITEDKAINQHLVITYN